MRDSNQKKNIVRLGVAALSLVGLFSISLSGCRSSVSSQDRKLSKVEYGQNVSSNGDSARGVTFSSNMAHEQAVADGCLLAWRTALKGDEKKAMEILEDLDKKHPGISTVQFMMGQVKEHSGNSKEAAFHYKKAVSVNEFSSVQSYKLAESLRKSGQAKESITYYEKLERNLDSATEEHGRNHLTDLLVSVRLGLAKAIIESGGDRAQAKTRLEQVLKVDPQNSEAKSLLSDLESG